MAIHKKKAQMREVQIFASFTGFNGNMIINSDKNRIM